MHNDPLVHLILKSDLGEYYIYIIARCMQHVQYYENEKLRHNLSTERPAKWHNSPVTPIKDAPNLRNAGLFRKEHVHNAISKTRMPRMCEAGLQPWNERTAAGPGMANQHHTSLSFVTPSDPLSGTTTCKILARNSGNPCCCLATFPFL